MILIDTDVLIFFLKGHQKTVTTVTKILQQDSVHLSMISLAEIYEGIYSQPQKYPTKVSKLNQLLTLINLLPIDEEICRTFGKLRYNLRQKNQLVDNFDLLIAATCITYDYTLYTGNLKHFQKIPLLKLYQEI